MKIFNKKLIFLSISFLAASKAFCAPGVYVENRTQNFGSSAIGNRYFDGVEISARIDYGTSDDWKKFSALKLQLNEKFKRDSNTFLPSEGGKKRGLYLRINTKDINFKNIKLSSTYNNFISEQSKMLYLKTKDKFSYPDQISIYFSESDGKFSYTMKETLKTHSMTEFVPMKAEEVSKTILESEKTKKAEPKIDNDNKNGIIVHNDSNYEITIGMENGSKLITIKSKEKGFIPKLKNAGNKFDFYWTFKSKDGEQVYKTANYYTNPCKIIIGAPGNEYLMKKTSDMSKYAPETAFTNSYEKAINLKEQKKIEPITKNLETKYATKLNNDDEFKLFSSISHKNDNDVLGFIKSQNLDPNYKLYSNNIIIYVIENKLVKTLEELLKRGADINIKSENKDEKEYYGKSPMEIAKEIGNSQIIFLLESAKAKTNKK